MNKITVYYMRHGEVYNPKRILYARLPRFPLSTKGRQEADLASQVLKDQKLDAIYFSPMLRTRQTSRIIAERVKIKPQVCSRLIELKIIFQGISADLYKEKYQAHLFDEQYLKKGQESIDQVYGRMEKYFQMLLRRHKGQKILTVSHGDPIGIFVAKTSGIEFTWEYKKNNYLHTGGVMKLDYDGKFKWSKIA